MIKRLNRNYRIMKIILVTNLCLLLVISYGLTIALTEGVSIIKNNNCKALNHEIEKQICVENLKQSWFYKFACVNMGMIFFIGGMEY